MSYGGYMKAFRWLGCLLLLGTLLLQPASGEELSAKLTNKVWKLAKWQRSDKPLKLDAIKKSGGIFMMMTLDGKVSGKAAINKFSGSYKLEGKNNISWGEGFASTKMAGTKELMDLETDFFTDLQKMTSYSLEGGQLRLSNQGGGTTMTFDTAKGAGVTKPE